MGTGLSQNVGSSLLIHHVQPTHQHSPAWRRGHKAKAEGPRISGEFPNKSERQPALCQMHNSPKCPSPAPAAKTLRGQGFCKRVAGPASHH